jgi:PGF-pre-PGF domain-containing protein
METKIGKFTLIAIVFIALAHIGSAVHFVCGVVEDSENGINAGWRTVMISNTADFVKNTTCQISPEDNAYCCDADDITGYTWSSGDTIYSQIIDDGTGYIFGLMSLLSTTDGYDSYATTELKFAVSFNSPDSSTKNETEVLINVSSIYPFTETLWYSINGTNYTLCNDCNQSNATVNLTDGTYNITLYGNDSDDQLYSTYVYFVVNSINDLPVIDSYSPSGTVTMDEGQSKEFNVNASDPDGTIPSYEWYLDDVLVDDDSGYTYIADFTDSGQHTLTVYVKDEISNVSQSWTINVNDVATCGDNVCNSNEACSTCSQDCGICQPEQQDEWLSGKWEKEEKIFTKITLSKPAFYKVLKGNISIKHILIFANIDIRNAKLKVYGLYEDIDVEDDILPYSFVKIQKINIREKELKEMFITFKVSKEWLLENNVSVEEVKIMSLDRDQDIKVDEYDEDENYILYTVDDKESSAFMIYTNKIKPDQGKEALKLSEEVYSYTKTGFQLIIMMLLLYIFIISWRPKNEKD